MNSPWQQNARYQRRLIHPPRAVIDIGSNTIRLVIYEGTARAPEIVWNEKVAARLGRDLSTTGRIPPEAMEEALAALARYALLVSDRRIENVQTVATAAARDAQNGDEFLARVAELGLEPRLLSGEEEARISAFGAIGAFPGARGMVADLGGGSLELVSIGDGQARDALSLPFGTLRLSALCAGDESLDDTVTKALADAGWIASHEGPLYMIGGTWRAFAHYAMQETGYPLTDPHAFVLSVEEARRIADKVIEETPENLELVPGVSPMRAGFLSDAASLLRVLLDQLKPKYLVFSSWGIREGLLFTGLSPLLRAQDPLLAAVHVYGEARDAAVTDAARVAGWTVELANGAGKRNERLRLASAQLAAALQRVEPNLRVDHAVEWALDKRWIDCTPRDRAMICAAMFGSLGRTSLPDRVTQLADTKDLREALTWGLGFRLARRLGAGSRAALGMSRLRVKKKSLVLYLDDSRSALATWPLTRDLEFLAEWIERRPKIKTGDFDFDDEFSDEEEEE